MLNDVGIYGLGSMGRNLSLNFVDKGFRVSVYNGLETDKKQNAQKFTDDNTSTKTLYGFTNLNEYVFSLTKPRMIIIIVTAGEPVNEVIAQLVPLLDRNDTIIDAGNSHYADTTSRLQKLSKYGIYFIGCGISGGWKGALHGPSVMLGGSAEVSEKVTELFDKVSAKDEHGHPCCKWMGNEGAGHFIKMIHNGIEYAMMQTIAEAYDILKKVLRLSNSEISLIFSDWNREEISGYLISATSNVLSIKDEDGSCLIDHVIDKSLQKGTGKDIAICGLDYGVNVSVIIEAVNARFLSVSELRNNNNQYTNNANAINDKLDHEAVVNNLLDTIYCSHLTSIIQGIDLIQKVSGAQSWDISVDKVFAAWKNGCIIKTDVINDISALLNEYTLAEIMVRRIDVTRLDSLVGIVTLGAKTLIPLPASSATLNYLLAIVSNSLPSNLIQLQREYFGSHGFELKGNPGTLRHLKDGIL
jgi:6-phosphogluconate dehydrogenase